MAKVRSPNYPAISLGEAITKIKAIYDEEHRNPTDKAVIAQHLGYTSLNGTSLSLISALAKYGLLEPIDSNDSKMLRVSEAAESIIWLDQGNSERVELLKQAAFAPSLFYELHEKFPEKLPSDQNLRFYLIKKEFNPKVVDSVIRAYRDTLEFVNEEEALEPSASDGIEEPLEESMQTQPARDSNPSYDANTNGRHMPTNPSYRANTNGRHVPTEQSSFEEGVTSRLGDCRARIQLDAPATSARIKRLIAYLKIDEEFLREAEESSKHPVRLEADELPLQRELLQQTEGNDESW